MSTAAPAAAPGSAPVAAPVAPAEAVPQSGAQQGVKSIKPIPPSRPRLPGVLEDGPEDASAPEAAAARARDAAGRFAKTTTGEPIVQKARPSAVEASDGEPTIPELPEAKPKIKFAGREFDDMAAIEREYKGQMERLQPTQRKLAEYEGQLVKAAESARGWHGEAQRLQAEIAALRQSPQPGAQSAETAATAEGGIDWALYAEISKVANEAGEPWKAQQWLQEQYDAQVRAEIARVREEAIENPRREAEARAQMEQTANTLVESMAAHENPDGSPAFPEFRDGEQTRAVGALWQSLGLDPHLVLTPGGAVAAVALYRMSKGMDVATSASFAPAAPVVSPPPDPAALAAAGLEGGRPLMPAAGNRTAMDPGVARLVAGLKNTQLIRPGLGFEA